MLTKKHLVWIWPFAVLPSMMISTALFLSVLSFRPLSVTLAEWWEEYWYFFPRYPLYTGACLLLLAWTCLRWLRLPNRETFKGTLLVGWGLLGWPAVFIALTIHMNLHPFGMNYIPPGVGG